MIFVESPLRDLYRLVVWGPYRDLNRRVPPPWEIELNRSLGLAASLVSAESLQRVQRNLRRAFPHRDDLDAVAHRVFATHFASQYLPMSFERMGPGNVDRYLEIEGLEHLHRAWRRGRGVVVMLPHAGPVQLPLCALGHRGYPVHQIGGGVVAGLSRIGQWAANRRQSMESHLPARVVDGKSFLRPVLRALRQGAVILTTCDGTGGGREIGRRTVRRVCGHPMRLPVSAVYLALRVGAPLLPLYTVRRGPRPPCHRTVIHPPVPLDRSLPLRRGLEAGADHLARFLEDFLQRHPGDWHFWDHFEPGRFLLASDEIRGEAPASGSGEQGSERDPKLERHRPGGA